jgi:hypothetical protein
MTGAVLVSGILTVLCSPGRAVAGSLWQLHGMVKGPSIGSRSDGEMLEVLAATWDSRKQAVLWVRGCLCCAPCCICAAENVGAMLNSNSSRLKH